MPTTRNLAITVATCLVALLILADGTSSHLAETVNAALDTMARKQ